MGNGLDPLVVRDFAIALLIGALLGIEREKRKTTRGDVGIAGLRTFVLFAQAGAVSAWLSRQQDSPWIFVATVLGVSALCVAGYMAQARARAGSLGLTTEVAGVATCLLGGLALFGHPELAVALAIVTSALLVYKQPLHRLVDRLGHDDLYAGLKLLIATFVVLPLLPNRTIDPLDAINPYLLWWLVILISSLSLVGYVAVRWLGTATGTALTGLFGGMVSSTAVTLAFARRSREVGQTPAMADALAAGVLVGWTVMFPRMVIVTAVVFAPIAGQLVAVFGIMGGAALLASAILYRRSRRAATGKARPGAEMPLRNPFSLSSAIQFALVFAVVLLVVELTERYLPDRGLYLVAAIAGLTDVDAIALSMAALARDGGSVPTAAGAILVAAIANTITKAGLVAALGSPALARRVAAGAALVLAGGLAALWLM